MDEAIEHEDRFYIVAGAIPADGRTLVLKHDDAFAIFNSLGDIENRGHAAQGLFVHGGRFLARWRLRINGQHPLLLSSRVTPDNTRLVIDLTNPDEAEHGVVSVSRGLLHIHRSILLCDSGCFEEIRLTSFALHPVNVTLSVGFASDFADIFEIRGIERARRGRILAPLVGQSTVVLGCEGLDGVVRRARIDCLPTPTSLSESHANFQATLDPHASLALGITVTCEPFRSSERCTYTTARRGLGQAMKDSLANYCRIDSSNRALTQWLNRSYADIEMLLTRTDEGVYPYAGVPWFSTPFGRDGVITALQLLWVNPQIARGVLRYLAATQAREADPQRDAEPGKILHERRSNEMAATGEVPFGQYYGSVDSTPLFIMLAGAYFKVTGDRDLLESIWPSIEGALEWIDTSGDTDGDGLVEYRCKSVDGLSNQGWKDSHDSVFHADGSLAEAPIALCEVQGYVFAAKQAAADVAAALGRLELSRRLSGEARQLQQTFDEAFWQPHLGTYALALDAHKQPCAVRTSNPGHCLFTGIVPPERASTIRDALMERSMYSGWGVRTVAAGEARYNPMSYHNGSIWPHDNALIAAGFARYGFRESAVRLCNGWFDASTFFDLHRLPELCCGFCRGRGKGPTLYPVACSPQAWAAGSVFMLLAACLGLSVDALSRRVHVHHPQLPRGVREIRVRGLGIAGASLDLLFRKDRRDVGVLVLRKEGPVDLMVTK